MRRSTPWSIIAMRHRCRPALHSGHGHRNRTRPDAGRPARHRAGVRRRRCRDQCLGDRCRTSDGAAARRHRMRWGNVGTGDARARGAPPAVVPDLPGLGEAAPVADSCPPPSRPGFSPCWMSGCGGGARRAFPGRQLAARLAGEHPGAIGRLVVSAAPGIGPIECRLDCATSPSAACCGRRAADAERFDRFALRGLDATVGAIPVGSRRSTSTPGVERPCTCPQDHHGSSPTRPGR